MLKSVYFVSNIQNPSWCFVVKQMYSIPASFASLTHSSGSYFTGLNSFMSFRYSARGVKKRQRTCSWYPVSEYIPQCTNIPNLCGIPILFVLREKNMIKKKYTTKSGVCK